MIGRIRAALAALAAFAGLVLAAYWRGRSTGRSDAETRAKDADNARSTEIETAADRARAADDAGHVDSLERLRDGGRLRD